MWHTRRNNSFLTSFGNPSLSVVDVHPDDGDDGHEGEGQPADVGEAVARAEEQPGEDKHSREGEAVQELQEKTRTGCLNHSDFGIFENLTPDGDTSMCQL